MRPIWKGAISFGLVNIPIKLMTATSKNNIRFRNLHQECHTPIKMKRYCPSCDREVEYDELVKGYEYEDDHYVILKDEDFDNIPVASTKTIDIVDFVELKEIDPIYYLKTYYLRPAEGGEKPYLLLKNSLKSTNKVAISRITIRTKESLAVVRIIDDALALETMYFADEVRSTEALNLDNLEEKVNINQKEQKLATEIIDNLTAVFEPEKYENEYRQELMEIIRGKIEGEEVEMPEAKAPDRKIVDLMEKLKASVDTTEEEADKKKDKDKEQKEVETVSG